jgi:hypothetical protein
VEGQHLSSLKRGSGEMVHSDTISNINWIVHLQRRRGKVTRQGGGVSVTDLVGEVWERRSRRPELNRANRLAILLQFVSLRGEEGGRESSWPTNS